MPGRKARSFGSIRRLPSGRWQARYRGPDGIMRSAPRTFIRKADASKWLALTQAELLSGGWTDPEAGRVPFPAYAAAWIEERPILTIGQVYALADAVPLRYKTLILLACFCGLRWGELAGLQRADVDCERKTIRIARQLCEVAGRPPFLAPTKSDAGKRTVPMPPMIVADIRYHLDNFTAADSDALVFTSPAGKHCGTVTSGAGPGSRRSPRLACAFTCMTCGIPEISSPPTQVPTYAS